MDIDDDDDFYAPEEPTIEPTQNAAAPGLAASISTPTEQQQKQQQQQDGDLEEGEEEDEGAEMEDSDSVCQTILHLYYMCLRSPACI